MEGSSVSSISRNKKELIESISNAYLKLNKDYESIPENQSRICAIEGNKKGTLISVCDTLSYLIGWGKLVLKWHCAITQNKEIHLPEKNYNWNQLGELALYFYSQYSSCSYPELLQEYSNVINELLNVIEELDNTELYDNIFYKKYTFGRMVQFNTSSPMKNVRIKIRRFKKENGIA